MKQLKQYVLDGRRSGSLEDFYDQISEVLIPGSEWGHNLAAFNDILRGGFGTPEEGFVLRWANSEIARGNLGYEETARQLEIRMDECHPANLFKVAEDLHNARRRVGPTVFDWLVEIVVDHGPGGEEAEDNVFLLLE